jgi:uncharacterized phage-like protein YoqJ
MEITKSNLKAYVEFIKSQTTERLFVVGATGHRLGEKVGGYTKEVEDNLLNISTNILDEINPTSVISGMATGWDTVIAKASLHLGIGLVAAIPFKKHIKYWDILNNPLTSSHIICEGGYEVWKLHRRNEWMADRANLMLAFWDGNKEGGTANCIEYCKKKNIPWINLYPTKKIIKEEEEEEKIIIGNLKNSLQPKLGYMDIICDRSNTLGNPYVLEKEEDREMCVKAFEAWLDTNFQAYKGEDLRDKKLDPALVIPGLKIAEKYKYPTVAEIMMNIVNLAGMLDSGQKIRLLCHCSPKLCHTTVIKSRLLEITNP